MLTQKFEKKTTDKHPPIPPNYWLTQFETA